MTVLDYPIGIHEVIGDYEIGDVLATQKLAGGMFLEPYRLSTTSGTYVLRAHQFRRTHQTFRFQAETVQLFHDTGRMERGESRLAMCSGRFTNI